MLLRHLEGDHLRRLGGEDGRLGRLEAICAECTSIIVLLDSMIVFLPENAFLIVIGCFHASTHLH